MSVPTIRCLIGLTLVIAVAVPATAAGTAAALPGTITGAPPAGPGTKPHDLRCTGAVDPAPQQAKGRVPRVFGWLYRWARGFDVERSTTPPPVLYLRSPLLAGFQDPVGCPPAQPAAERTPRQTCVAIVTGDGQDRPETWLALLPQLGARTPDELAAVLRERMDVGETVPVRLIGGAAMLLDPGTVGELAVRKCGTDTD